MAERQASKSHRNRERQPISVPFVWEDKPGMPKKDWKPSAVQTNKPVASPVKLVVSVPFGWEEKPGTPLSSFAPPPHKQSTSATSSQQSIILLSPPSQHLENSYGKWSTSNGGKNNQDRNGGDGSSDSEIETCSFETYDSFSSARSTNPPSIVAPVQQAYFATMDDKSKQIQSPGSPDSETESLASSYATGTTSLVGASFLEWLFPLLAPNSSEPKPNGVGCLETDSIQRVNVQGEEFLQENNRSRARRPLLTLGELIVMSRRRSCQRKIMKMQKQTSMDFMKRNALGCCIFRGGNGMGTLSIKWKRQLLLKLM